MVRLRVSHHNAHRWSLQFLDKLANYARSSAFLIELENIQQGSLDKDQRNMHNSLITLSDGILYTLVIINNRRQVHASRCISSCSVRKYVSASLHTDFSLSWIIGQSWLRDSSPLILNRIRSVHARLCVSCCSKLGRETPLCPAKIWYGINDNVQRGYSRWRTSRE